MRDAFIKRLSELAEKDDRIFLITADLGFKVLDEFAKKFPKQFLNCGVAEQNMTALATGLAMEGRVVFTYSIGNFPTLRCLEHIRNDACYHNANVNVVCIGGGFSYGSLGISHHATEDISILRSLPNMTVVAPGDDDEAMAATTAMVAKPGAGYLRLDRVGKNVGAGTFVLGKARLVREGHAITIISTGGILEEAVAAADRLAEAGIESRVLSMHTIKPIDEGAILNAARETGGIITLEEHTIHGGLGSAVAEVLLDAGVMPKRFSRIALREGFSCKVGSQEYLRKAYGLDADAVVACAQSLLSAAAPSMAVIG